jgi:hypothetical protein
MKQEIVISIPNFAEWLRPGISVEIPKFAAWLTGEKNGTVLRLHAR